MSTHGQSAEAQTRLNADAAGAALARLAGLQATRPWWFLGAAALVTAAALALASRLVLLTGVEHLLPESRPSVQELERVSRRIAGVSSVFVVLEGGPASSPTALRAAGDAIAAELQKLGPPWIGRASTGVHEARRFLEPRAGLFVPLDALGRLHRAVKERYDHAVIDAFAGGIDEEAPPPLSADEVRAILGVEPTDPSLFPGGYFQSEDGRTLVVAALSQVAGGEFSRATEAMARIGQAVERADPTAIDPAIRWGFAGDLASGVNEYRAIRADLAEVGLLGAGLLVLVTLLYYLRLRTLLAMALTIGVGVAWTFGLTQLLVGHLNAATGFLFSIVAGNGINFGILYMARYLEARQQGEPLLAALGLAHRQTWASTLTAAFAAAVAYGSLVVTDFRGFRDFGLIGASGMLVCWTATYLILPPILAALERMAPLRAARSRFFLLGVHGGLSFGAPFALLARRFPRGLAVLGMATAVVGAGIAGRYALSDPMEYDLRKIRTDMSARAEEVRLNRVADSLTGFVGLDAMAIVVDRREQVGPLQAALEARRDAADANAKPFDAVFTLQRFVPDGQPAKIELLGALRQMVVKARERGAIDDPTWAELSRYLPPADLAPFGIDDLPAALASPFTEADGTRGRIVYLSPTATGAIDDAHYLFRWADSYRETVLPDGSVVRGSGRAVIYADIFEAVLSDVPRAVLASLLGTLLVVAVAFRGRALLLGLVLGTVLIGVAWLGAALALAGVRLTFLNFVALPITFGIGVDYAVNVAQRYRFEGAGGALRAVRATGGAVVLCSLTTIVGYLSLLGSDNQGIRGLGLVAALGELCCLGATVLVLPSILVWRDGRRVVPPVPISATEASHG